MTNPTGPIQSVAEGSHISWIIRILPYLEQAGLARHFVEDAGSYGEKNKPVREAIVSVLHCPSSPEPRNSDESGISISHTTYAGCHHDGENPIDSNNNGVLFLNSEIGFEDIEDGSSTLLLVGGHFIDIGDLGWVSGTRATLRNTSKIEERPENWRQRGASRPFLCGGIWKLSSRLSADWFSRWGNASAVEYHTVQSLTSYNRRIGNSKGTAILASSFSTCKE